MNDPGIVRWTRKGLLQFSWTRFESLDKLVMNPSLRECLIRRADPFQKGKTEFHNLNLTWRQGHMVARFKLENQESSWRQ